jgi:hypothetical protein
MCLELGAKATVLGILPSGFRRGDSGWKRGGLRSPGYPYRFP